MSTALEFFERPRLRDGVWIEHRDVTSLRLAYRSQGCTLEFPPEGRAEAERLFGLLTAGASLPEMSAACPGYSEQLPSLLSELDKLGVLTDASFASPHGGLTGRQFYRELVRFADRWQRQVAASRFFHALCDGEATRHQVIGYAIEYYHLVRLSISLIAPALGHTTSRRSWNLLQEFVVSELHHDEMMVESLTSVGIERHVLDELQPLPATFALCSALGVLAAQDPLSFKSCLFLFERTSPEFNAALVEQSRQVGLPAAFYEPIVRHAGINDDADHGDISLELLEDVGYVSAEEQQVVQKHAAVLIETLVALERQILDHYRDEKRLALRHFH